MSQTLTEKELVESFESLSDGLFPSVQLSPDNHTTSDDNALDETSKTYDGERARPRKRQKTTERSRRDDEIEYIISHTPYHYYCLFSDRTKGYCAKGTFENDNTRILRNLYKKCQATGTWIPSLSTQYRTREALMFEYLKMPRNERTLILSVH